MMPGVASCEQGVGTWVLRWGLPAYLRVPGSFLAS